jgi:anti-anti-sigma regulatory factor
MLKTRIDQSGGTGLLVLEGKMIIDHMEELKIFFLEALSSGRDLEVNLDGADKVDMFGLQMLCAAHRSAMKAGKELTLIGEQPKSLRDAIVMAGYGRTAVCSEDKTCPWNKR